MLTVFNSRVRSKIEYSCEVWNPFLIKDICKIEQVQRAFTCRIAGMRDYNYWQRLKKLNIMSLQRRREKIIIIHLWKILHNFYPNSINLSFKHHPRSNAIKALLKPLPQVRGSTLTKFDGSFEIKSAKLWNVLPPLVTNLSTLELFKKSLNNFLSKVPDEPPLPGYPYRCDNSIINQIICT